MATILSSNIYAPMLRVEIGEKLLSPTAIISVSIDENLKDPSKFNITLNEGLDIKTQRFTWLDNPDINPGKKVEIYFGYSKEEPKNPMMGIIKALRPSFPSTGIPSLTMEGYDLSHSMQKRMSKIDDENAKYSDIAKEMAAKFYNLKAVTNDSGEKYQKVPRKPGQNDYEFLKDLAKEIGFEFFVQRDTLYFRKPKDDKKPVKTFYYRKNFISFAPRLSTASLINEVCVTGYNAKTKKRIKESVKLTDICTGPDVGFLTELIKVSEGLQPKKIEDIPLESEDKAKSIAEEKLKEALSNYYIPGTLECVGDPELRPGILIEIDGLGKLFSGKYYIASARHSFDNNGYRTTLEVRRSVI